MNNYLDFAAADNVSPFDMNFKSKIPEYETPFEDYTIYTYKRVDNT